MSDDLRNQVYISLSQRSDEEILDIWQTNDRVEWTDLTFEVLRDVLIERMGELPPQNSPVLSHEVEEPEEEDEDAPVFYKPDEVFWLTTWINRAAVAAAVASIILSLFSIPQVYNLVYFYFSGNPGGEAISTLFTIVMVPISTIIQCVIIYFPLKALATILKILMEMEFTSRGIKE